MTFATQSKKIGRKPIQVVEIDLDFCSLTFGTGSCPAQGAADSKCFNTFGTCPVQDSFDKTVKTYRFVDQELRPLTGLDAFPAIVEIDYAGTTIRPGGGLGDRAEIEITLQDFTHNDHGIDPYASERTYDTNRGTFATKLLARNRYYKNRSIRIREGYQPDSGAFAFTHFRDREYIIKEISPPNGRGRWTIKAVDRLSLIADKHGSCPRPTEAYLDGVHNTSTTTFTLVNSAQAYAVIKDETDTKKRAAINNEIIEVGSQSGRFLINCLRAQGGTEAAEHGDGDRVQHAKSFTGIEVTTIYQTLLTGFGNVSSSTLDWSQWRQESNALDAFTLTTIIPEPTPVDDLVEELNRECLINLWDEDLDGLIKLKLETPWSIDVASLTDQDHLVNGSVSIRELHEERVDEVHFYYGVRNYMEDLEADNMTRFHREVATTEQGSLANDEQAIEEIYSRWFPASLSAQVEVAARRKLERFKYVPREIEWQLDAKDVSSASVGSVVTMATSHTVDIYGAADIMRVQILEVNIDVPSTLYAYRGWKYFGAPNENEVWVVTSLHADYNLWDELSQPSAPLNITVRLDGIPYGVNSYGLGIHTMPAGSIVTLINCSEAYGYGGEPGKGGNAQTIWDGGEKRYTIIAGNGQDATDGGPAILVGNGVTLRIYNDGGYIRAGGGGGGGAGGYGANDRVYGGGGAAAGRGYPVNSGGLGGTTSELLTDGILTDGNPGQWSSVNTVGIGGDGGLAGTGQRGGSGGDYGEDGTEGATPQLGSPNQNVGWDSAYGLGGAPGIAGKAVQIVGSGTVEFITGNTSDRVKGAIDS